MKFTCEKALLVSAISVAGRTVSPKSTIACLEGILLRAGVGVQLTGFNLETGITVKVAAAVTEAGACVMPARLFFDIIRKLPDEEVTVEVDDKLQVSIRGGASFFQITAMDAEDYPELPDVNSEKGVAIPQTALREMIGGTIFSVSENQARPIHTGCLMEVRDDGITMVAVDSFRLARRTWHSEEPIGREMKFVVPATGLREVEKILSETDEPVVFTLGAKHILFEIGDATLVCRVLEGEFIDWRRVVPTNNSTILTEIGFLHPVNKISFMIGLTAVNFNISFRCFSLNQRNNTLIGKCTIDILFTDTDHIQIRSIEYHDSFFHFFSSFTSNCFLLCVEMIIFCFIVSTSSSSISFANAFISSVNT